MTKFNYLPHTNEDRRELLDSIGLISTEDLFSNIPENLKDVNLCIGEPLSEMDLQNKIMELAYKNKWPGEYMCFLGAGCYDRFIPSAVSHITSRAEFLTAYTPYQPEISQGTLQAIYEFQTMMCNITGMDVSNASMYDGATAAAEALLMACRITRKSRVLVARTLDPEAQSVINTYLAASGIDIVTIKMDQHSLDVENLKSLIDEHTAGVIIQIPNFLGSFEDIETIEKITHEAKALFIAMIDPLSTGLLKPPGKYNADIVVGNGQPLGNNMMFGGPGFGILACKQEYVRQLPGRIIGATVDAKGERSFVLTLQTREQHIKREKATSNICTNHSLNALSACVYLSLIGPKGLKEIANISFQRAHYLADKINAIKGFKVLTKNFFNEFVMLLPPELTCNTFIARLLNYKIIAGVDISGYYTEIPNSILVSVTEMNSPVELYLYATILQEISKELYPDEWEDQ